MEKSREDSGFFTKNDAQPWWQVNLLERRVIDKIIVYNMTKPYNGSRAAMKRADSLVVSVSDDGSNWREIYRHNGKTFGGAHFGRPLKIPVKAEYSRYVRLHLAKSNYFHLDEVKVLGRKLP